MKEVVEIEEIIKEAIGSKALENHNEIYNSLSDLKKDAVFKDDQDQAKYLWCLETTLKIIDIYLESFILLKSKEFYKAWCKLEEIEIKFNNLRKHFSSRLKDFHIDFIIRIVEQYQSLYPYKIFASTEFLEIEKKCNICDQIIDIRNNCGHRVGEIYNGEWCIRIVTDIEILGISAVTKPVHKYSVLFLTDPETGNQVDQYDYDLVNWVVERLENPFDNWKINWTKIRHPHTYFKHINDNDDCLCESGKTYLECCKNEDGVLRPHCEIYFSKKPKDKNLSEIKYYY